MAIANLQNFALALDEEIRNLGKFALGGGAQPQDPYAPTRQYQNIQDQFYQGMLDRGIDPMFAQGLMYNIPDESGWRMDAQEAAPIAGRGGKGYYQLTGPRRDSYESMYGDNWSTNNQLDFLKSEVMGPERAAYEWIIANSNSPQEAAVNVMKRFLRPAQKHAEARAAKYMSSKGGGPIPNGGEYSDLNQREQEAQVDPAVERRQYWGAALNDLGSDLINMSHGRPADAHEMMNAFYARREEAKRRLSELADERRRRDEWYQNRSWQEADQQTAIDAQIAAEDRRESSLIRQEQRADTRQQAAEVRAEGYKVAAEDRDVQRIEAERKRISGIAQAAGPIMFPGVNTDTLTTIADIDGNTAMQWAEMEQTKADAVTERERVQAERLPISQMYEDAGFPDLAQMNLTDPIGARDAYKERTRTTDNTLEARILKTNTPEALSLATRLKLEAGTQDARITNSANAQDAAIREAEAGVNAARAFARQLEYIQNLAASSDTEQGFLSSLLLVPDKFFAELGIDRNNVSRRELFDAATKRSIAGVLAAENKGAASDRDVAFFQASLPSLGDTREANVAIAYANRELLRREEVYTNAWREFYQNSDEWMNADKRQQYIQQKMEEAGATGDILKRIADVEDALSMPPGTPFIIVGDDGSQLLTVAE